MDFDVRITDMQSIETRLGAEIFHIGYVAVALISN